MKWVVIGHRGVGKSALLVRLHQYFRQGSIAFFDLDKEIETRFKKSISELFTEVGEPKFREIEIQVFSEIQKFNQNYIIAAGAGFLLKESEILELQSIKILWVRRETDKLGRIFFNRPRLNSSVSSLAEFQERYKVRQKNYQEMANEVYIMPEGLDDLNLIEEKILTEDQLSAKGVLTLMPWHFKQSPLNFLRYGCDFYEIRDDLINFDQFDWKWIPQQFRLFSFRKKESVQQNLKFIVDMAETDWPLELGVCPSSKISIISCHEYLENETLTDFLIRLEKSALPSHHLKAAPEIKNYDQLNLLLAWQQIDPFKRSVLPRTKAGEQPLWRWVRLYLKGRQKINFWRDSDGSSADQPTLFEWLSTNQVTTQFAALLGHPVDHSRTMVEQSTFFAERNWPVWAIPLVEEEFKGALRFLFTKGLQAAAVTSPLKKVAELICRSKSPEATELQAVNTIAIAVQNNQLSVNGHNTDLIGFQKLMEKVATDLNTSLAELSVVVWGGGGTLNVIQKIIPQALQISMRTRLPREMQKKIPDHCQVLVWAAGPEDAFPPDFDFDLLVDLNYREDSQAREWALKKKKPYISGDLMFKAQAAGQREYWKKKLT